jgi:hypothetical protein
MNSDPEELLSRLKPRRTSAELRQQVLSAAAGELRTLRQMRWMRRIAFATAALLVFGIAVNCWVKRDIEAQIAGIYSSSQLRKTAGAAYFAVFNNNGLSSAERYSCFLRQRIAGDSDFFIKESHHEKMENEPRLDGHRPGDRDREHIPSGCLQYLDCRNAA